MIFSETAIPGVVVVEPEPVSDERGLFTRLYAPSAFERAGIAFSPVETSLSRNSRALTLRGLHYQPAPFAETKLVRVSRGRAFDVCVDLRPESPTYRRWVGVELDAARARAVFIPEGIAHGFLTLEDDTDLIYQISPAYVPGHDAGVRWDDPAFGIEWPPAERRIMAPKDEAWPDFEGSSYS